MNEEIRQLIDKLRHDAVVGGGYADVHTDDLEKLFAEIKRLGDRLVATAPRMTE